MSPKTLSTLSQKSATVAENGETTATVAEFKRETDNDYVRIVYCVQCE